jgi:hypothetical protein
LLERLTLFIHPRRVVLERRGWRGKPSRQVLAVSAPAAGEADWQPALAAAESLLQANGRRGASLRIVVADPFVRYALLPWSELVISRPARLAMARALLRNALGDKAAGLDIALDRPVFGRSGIAAGIDSRLLAALRAAAKGAGLRLGSLQPRLIVELAAHRRQLADGWFACLDAGWISLLGLRGGEIASLHNHRAVAGELAGLLSVGNATVSGKKVHISANGVAPPVLAGSWETVVLAAAVGGDADA